MMATGLDDGATARNLIAMSKMGPARMVGGKRKCVLEISTLESNIAAALRQAHNDALDEAAKVAKGMRNSVIKGVTLGPVATPEAIANEFKKWTAGQIETAILALKDAP